MKNIFTILFLLSVFFSFAEYNIISDFESLEHSGEYEKALNLLRSNLNTEEARIELRWRIAQITYELSEQKSSRKDKIYYYDIGIEATKPYINNSDAPNRDRAELIHWYAVNYSSKIRLLGIFAGLKGITLVEDIFKLIDKMIATDASYSNAYFFRAKIRDEVPAFLGGDPVKTSLDYQTAIQFSTDKSRIVTLLEYAASLKKRNWSAQTKINELKKYGLTNDGTPLDISDKEYAIILLTELENFFNAIKNPSLRDKLLFLRSKNMLDNLE